MLKGIFGNKNAERVLLHIYHYGEVNGSAIAKDYKIALDPILKQLARFEEAGILLSKEVGRSRLYSFNPKSPFLKPVKEILELAYRSIPMKEREKLFQKRRRPRKKGKRVN